MSDTTGMDAQKYVARFGWKPLLDPAEVRAQLSQCRERHYVYVLFLPDGEPFYVGKGIGSRALFHESEARNLPFLSHKLNVIRAIHRAGRAVGYCIDSAFDDEEKALARERFLIQSIGRHDLGTGPLTNQTDGGEGKSNPSDESRARRAATLGGDASDPDRKRINELFNEVGAGHASVAIKPLGTRRLVPLTPHPNLRRPTKRMATALVVAAITSNTILAPRAVIPRAFEMDGAIYVIENGVGRDMLKAGLVTLLPGVPTPEEEQLVLTSIGYHFVVRTFGRDRLIDLGTLEPVVD